MDFYTRLFEILFENIDNNYSDNYDYYRFPKIEVKKQSNSIIHKKFFKKNNEVDNVALTILKSFNEFKTYFKGFSQVYDSLYDTFSKEIYTLLVAYKILGGEKILLNGGKEFLTKVDVLKHYVVSDEIVDSGIDHIKLQKFDLKDLGYDLKLYSFIEFIHINFIRKQYCYQTSDVLIKPKPGDVVIDGGACWGDSSLLFASMVGENGKVYSFEFDDYNKEIFNKNISLNQQYSKIIELRTYALWDTDEEFLKYNSRGPASKIFLESDSYLRNMKSIETISIDKFISKENIPKIDFIKMDIEGAETKALNGAINSIKRFKPTLAITIYHSNEDFVNIPIWIDKLNIGYKIFIGHHTIHNEETVVFATIL